MTGEALEIINLYLKASKESKEIVEEAIAAYNSDQEEKNHDGFFRVH